jgi:hypothetical protein
MPSGGNSLAFLPDPDEVEQELIVIAVVSEWFGPDAEHPIDVIDPQDIADCAGNIVEALNARRCALLEDAVGEGPDSWSRDD